MSNCLCAGIRDGILSATHVVKSVLAAKVVFAFVFLAMPAYAEKGQSSYKRGRDLEARQNYEAAYDAYERAYDADPAECSISGGTHQNSIPSRRVKSAACDIAATSGRARRGFDPISRSHENRPVEPDRVTTK